MQEVRMKKEIYDLRFENIVSELAGLRKTDLEKLAQQVSTLLTGNKQLDLSVYGLSSNDVHICHKCGSVKLAKHGCDARGNQRYKCKDCGSTRTAMSANIFSGSHKDAEQWKKFILFTLEGRSLRYCAEHCKISLPTSFNWRHKILSALTSEQFAEVFNGLVEIDEAFVNVSYKGNHSKSKKFTMPRPAYKRGSDNKTRKASEKACVVCAAERNKGFSGVVTHRGALNHSILSEVFDNHITDDTIILTDESTALKKYFSTKPYAHMPLGTTINETAEKNVPVVKGPYHINNINSLHQRFRDFLRQYNGVSTKHLNGYVALFIWLENERKREKNTPNHLVKYLISNPTRMTNEQVSNVAMPPVA